MAHDVAGEARHAEEGGDVRAPFLRDVAPLHVPALPGSAVDLRHGRPLPHIADGLAAVARRQVLRAEVEEVQGAEARLDGLRREWEGRPRPAPEDEAGRAAEAEVAEGLARQSAYLLASQVLLLRTHARWEQGLDAEVETALLRVWLDGAAVALEGFAGRVRAALRPPRQSDRPLVEPWAGPPLGCYADYLAGAAPYTEGDFLAGPVDLLHPRLVPEMVAPDPGFPPDGNTRAARPTAGGWGTAREVLDPRQINWALTDTARMRKLIARVRAAVAGVSGTVPGWAAWRLRRMEEHLFSALALAVEVDGRWQHPHTRSIRLESVLARMFVAERLDQVRATAAEIRALAGTPDEREGEGPPREGAGFLARFFILKKLAGRVLPRWAAGGAAPAPRHVGREVLELEALKASFRQRFGAAAGAFGAGLWQNPNLQADCFALAEAAAWLKAADSTLGRVAWLSRAATPGDDDEPAPALELGRRALARCMAEVRDRLYRFEEDFTRLLNGYYAPHVGAAALLLDRPGERSPAPPAPRSHITRPLALLVFLEPVPVRPHRPEVDGPAPDSCGWSLGETDGAALEVALRLRDAAPGLVTLQVAAVGPPAVGPLLREVLGLGVDRVRLAVCAAGAPPDGRAAALLPVFREGPRFDLILGGGGPGGPEPLVARLTAAAPGVPYAGRAAAVAVRATDTSAHVFMLNGNGRPVGECGLPAALAVEAGQGLRPFTVPGYLAGLARDVEMLPGTRAGTC
jgi:hypothetical protein